MSSESVADRLTRLIDAHGPISVSTYVEQALYGDGGFYMAGGQAGRRGDFITAPEVGPLFGAVLARALDSWWRELGEPESITVLEWGAGPGTLARAVLDAAPDVLTGGALRWTLIERSPRQRDLHPTHDQVVSVPAWPPVGEGTGPIDHGIVLANELLDNLPFDIYERRDHGWADVRIDRPDADGRFTETLVPVGSGGSGGPGGALAGAAEVPVGARVPVQLEARAWVQDAIGSISNGRVVVFDYGAGVDELATRDGRWLRTHAGHQGASDWLTDPGACDITVDVDFDQLQLDRPADTRESQAQWLDRHGINELVEEGRSIWERSAGIGDLAALKARSRIREAEALLDPVGMGSFQVLEWTARK